VRTSIGVAIFGRGSTLLFEFWPLEIFVPKTYGYVLVF